MGLPMQTTLRLASARRRGRRILPWISRWHLRGFAPVGASVRTPWKMITYLPAPHFTSTAARARKFFSSSGTPSVRPSPTSPFLTLPCDPRIFCTRLSQHIRPKNTLQIQTFTSNSTLRRNKTKVSKLNGTLLPPEPNNNAHCNSNRSTWKARCYSFSEKTEPKKVWDTYNGMSVEPISKNRGSKLALHLNTEEKEAAKLAAETFFPNL